MEDTPPPFIVKAKGPDGQPTPASTRLRKAVNEKLSSILGSHADDVFVDYVVVMLSHGRSSKLMTDDLDAFLGSNSEEFVDWYESNMPVSVVILAKLIVFALHRHACALAEFLVGRLWKHLAENRDLYSDSNELESTTYR